MKNLYKNTNSKKDASGEGWKVSLSRIKQN